MFCDEGCGYPWKGRKWTWSIALRKVNGSGFHTVPWRKMARSDLVNAELMKLLATW